MVTPACPQGEGGGWSPRLQSRLIPLDASLSSREPQERMEPPVSEETKEILASRVPGASR